MYFCLFELPYELSLGLGQHLALALPGLHLDHYGGTNLVQVPEFNIVALDDVNVVKLKALEALRNAGSHPGGTEVKLIRAIAANLCRHNDLVSGKPLQAAPKHLVQA